VGTIAGSEGNNSFVPSPKLLRGEARNGISNKAISAVDACLLTEGHIYLMKRKKFFIGDGKA